MDIFISGKELKNVEHSYVNCRKFGDLSSFEWIESHVKYAARTNEELVHIYYSALNFKDVMLATGKLSVGTTKSSNFDCFQRFILRKFYLRALLR